MGRARSAGWAAVLLLGLVGGVAHACSCLQRDPHGVAGADIVFAGQVTRIEANADVRRIHFRVLKPFWGAVDSEVVLSEPLASPCRALFEPGVEYLVYGYGRNTSGQSGYTTTRCDPNVPLASAGDQLTQLEFFVRHAKKNPMEFDFKVP